MCLQEINYTFHNLVVVVNSSELLHSSCVFSIRSRTILYLQLQNVGHCVGKCRSKWRGRRQNANSSTWIFKLIPVLKVKRLAYLFKHEQLFLLLKLTQVFWLLGLAGSTVCSSIEWEYLRPVFMGDLLTPLAASHLYHCWDDTSFPMGEGSREENPVHPWHPPEEEHCPSKDASPFSQHRAIWYTCSFSWYQHCNSSRGKNGDPS